MKYLHPKKYWRIIKEVLNNFFWYYLLPDSWEIFYHFKKKVGYAPNLKNPKSFNEKIQWLKLNDRDSRYPDLIDKFKVKDIVKDILGEEFVIPTILGPYYDVEDIPWNELPEQYVIKCNHDAASVVICKDRSIFDVESAKKHLSSCLKRNYYHDMGKQWGYKNIQPCVFIERYMHSSVGDLDDYKFMVFNGDCRCVFICKERYSTTGLKLNFYTPEWELMPFIRSYPNASYSIKKPESFEKMKEIAERLARYVNNPFVRIDLYDINGRIYFGEFTFYPGGGLEAFQPLEWDYTLGSWIKLPIDK